MRVAIVILALVARPMWPEGQATIYDARPPIGLGNVRLRRLAEALGPAHVRVSGSWANSVYFHDADTAEGWRAWHALHPSAPLHSTRSASRTPGLRATVVGS